MIENERTVLTLIAARERQNDYGRVFDDDEDPRLVELVKWCIEAGEPIRVWEFYREVKCMQLAPVNNGVRYLTRGVDYVTDSREGQMLNRPCLQSAVNRNFHRRSLWSFMANSIGAIRNKGGWLWQREGVEWPVVDIREETPDRLLQSLGEVAGMEKLYHVEVTINGGVQRRKCASFGSAEEAARFKTWITGERWTK